MGEWSADARARSLEGLQRMKAPEPPQVADSDLIVMAINRLQRAVGKMQAYQYDDELQEHLSRAGEMLGWVAENMLSRAGSTGIQDQQNRGVNHD